jgi:hypothetical protein
MQQDKILKAKNINFLIMFLKNTQILNIVKIHLVGAELFHMDRQTETDRRDELMVVLCNFSECP